MLTKQAVQGPDVRDTLEQEAGLVEAVIADRVLEALGTPTELHRVQVKPVWGDNFRVNVYAGPHSASLRVAHSYFLRADQDGKILACSPPLERAY